MALREEKYKPDIPVGNGINITNPHKKKTGIKFTETEILILSENGSVIGILDRKYFSTGKDDEGDDAPGAKSVKGKKAKTTAKKANTKPTTKKAGKK